MRKGISLVGVLALLMMLACPVFATNTFVPSVTYKDTPPVEDATLVVPDTGNDIDVEDCLEITSILQAEEQTTDISQEARDLLLEVYEELSQGEDNLFDETEDQDYEIIQLVDVSFKESACIDSEHPHQELLEVEDVLLVVEFDLGVMANDNVVVMYYYNGQWLPIENVVNNGDGTVTCVFERICPVAFCVEVGEDNTPPQTGDEVGTDMILWLSAMLISMAGLMVLLVLHRRANQK